MHITRSSLLAAALAAFAFASPVRANDDRDLQDPTGWVWYHGQTSSQVAAIVNQGFRIVDLEVESVSPLRLAIATVHNSGPYARTWWYYFGVSATSVSNLINQNSARLIDIEPYDNGSGSLRFAVVMVRNTGSNAKAWWWYINTSMSNLNQLASQNTARITDLELYTLGRTSYRAAIMISNTGRDARAWYWYLNSSTSTLSSAMSQNNLRIYDLETRGNGRYDAILVRNTGETWWWYVSASESALSEALANNGARLIDVESYSTVFGKRFNAVLINNSNALTARIGGILRGGTSGKVGCYLKRVGGGVRAGLRQDFQFEPASSIKVLHHTHAMRQVELGRASLGDQVRVYTGMNGSCPNYSTPIFERLDVVLRKMMEQSDNARTLAVRNHFGEAAIEATAAALGMSRTSLEHRIGCGGPPQNNLTLTDAGRLYERVATGYIGRYRQTFYDLMLTGVPSNVSAIIDQEAASLGLPGQVVNFFKGELAMAYKGGSYTYLGPTQEFRTHCGWIRIPFRSRGAMAPRDFVYGVFVHQATSGSNAGTAMGTARAEILRDELRAALATWDRYSPGTATAFGSSCAGSNGLPVHSLSGTPEIGQSFDLRCTNVGAPVLPVLVLGTGNRSWNGIPLPLDLTTVGAPGCAVRVDYFLGVPLSGGRTGTASLPVRMPYDPSFVGQRLYTQFWNVDTAANAYGVSFSNGVVTAIGGYN